MNVLNDYTRRDTKLIEGLSLNDNEQLVPKLAANTLTTGTAIDLYKVRQSQSIPDFNLSKTWTLYPIDLHTILKGTGTYIILIKYGSALYSGIMSYVDESTADLEDEIPLHANGTLTRADVTEGKEGRLYAKLALTTYNSATYPLLYLAASVAESNANSHISSVKFRKLI